MKFSERWVREWVDPPIDTDALVAQLTAAGLEVESVEPVSGPMTHVRVAEIVRVAPHPGAERLRLCEVDDGRGEIRRVVCGAPNARIGLRTAFAPAGACLPDGVEVRESRIRGELSQGMLCSARELGLGEDSRGILELDRDAPPGTDLVECLALGDVSVDVGVTPNRGDCLCIAGLAREVAVANRIPVKRSGRIGGGRARVGRRAARRTRRTGTLPALRRPYRSRHRSDRAEPAVDAGTPSPVRRTPSVRRRRRYQLRDARDRTADARIRLCASGQRNPGSQRSRR